MDELKKHTIKFYNKLYFKIFNTERIIKILKFVIWYNPDYNNKNIELNFYDKKYYYECDKLFWIVCIIRIKVRKDDRKK